MAVVTQTDRPKSVPFVVVSKFWWRFSVVNWSLNFLLVYWWALNYRKNSIIGCRVISRTSSADLQNLNTVSSAA